MENRFNDLMESGYNALFNKKTSWPKGFTNTNKIEVCKSLLDYFQGTEDYRKCIALSKKIKLLSKVKREKPLKPALNLLEN